MTKILVESVAPPLLAQKLPVPNTISGTPSPVKSPTTGDEYTISFVLNCQSSCPKGEIARTKPPL